MREQVMLLGVSLEGSGGRKGRGREGGPLYKGL